jgi:predicted GNAT family N-acyltransferase
MPLEIRRVTDPAELEEVFRLRYRVYVQELQYPQRYADPRSQTVREPLDEVGHILGAFDHGRLVGTCRINPAAESDLGEYVELYQLQRFVPLFPRHVSVTTKGVMAPEYRTGAPCLKMVLDGFRYLRALTPAICFDFIDARPHLLPLHRKVGYRQVFPEFQHPDIGVVVHPLVLVANDQDYLRQIHSPLASVQKDDGSDENDSSVRFFYERFSLESASPSDGAVFPGSRRERGEAQ